MRNADLVNITYRDGWFVLTIVSGSEHFEFVLLPNRVSALARAIGQMFEEVARNPTHNPRRVTIEP